MDYDRRPVCPAFVITIDTEGDNLWARPRQVTTRNAGFLSRFQSLCERYGLRPTYMTDWDMVQDPVFRELAMDILRRGAGEIGMHLHAWNTPPLTPLTSDDDWYHPYLIEYPYDQMKAKVSAITARLEDTFGVHVVSHRAGRWSFNALYARILVENGYQIDCSVTPHVSWKAHLGAPDRNGGSDYSTCPETTYFLDSDDITRRGMSPLLEVPVSIIRKRRPTVVEILDKALPSNIRLVERAMERFPKYIWLRPNGRNLKDLHTILEVALQDGRDYVEFMLHSSELMPGGSPTFQTEGSIEKLYEDLDALFCSASRHFEGRTLAEYYADRMRLAEIGAAS